MNIFNELPKILPYIVPVGGFLLGAYKDKIMLALNIKKENTQIDGLKTENFNKNLDLYQELIDDLDTRYKKRLTDIEDMFNTQLESLKSEIQQLKDLNEELTEINRKNKELIERLQKELKQYKNN